MRVLVTGATGLIGCYVADALLRAGHEVRVFVRDAKRLEGVLSALGRSASDCEIAVGSLSDETSVRSAVDGCTGLVHCAGVFSPDREAEQRLVATNVGGTKAVLEAATQLGLERIVYLSSILALFPPSGATMTAEDEVADPKSMYAKTKAAAERVARDFQAKGPVQIIYPAAVHGPEDPTFSIGPQLIRDALVSGEVLVTGGGLPYTDVRDLVTVVVALIEGRSDTPRIMAPAFFLPHDAYHRLLEDLTGRSLKPRRVPGSVLRMLGRFGDLAQKFGKNPQLTYEAASVLTQSVPVDDRPARALLTDPAREADESFRDLLAWMLHVGHLAPEFAGTLADRRTAVG